MTYFVFTTKIRIFRFVEYPYEGMKLAVYAEEMPTTIYLHMETLRFLWRGGYLTSTDVSHVIVIWISSWHHKNSCGTYHFYGIVELDSDEIGKKQFQP